MRSTNCEEVRERLGFLVEGSLEGPAARETLAHLEHCQACRQEKAELTAMLAALPGLPAPAPPADFTARVMGGLEQAGVFGTAPARGAAESAEQALFPAPGRAGGKTSGGFLRSLAGLATGKSEGTELFLGLRRGLAFAAAAVYLVIVGWFVGLLVSRQPTLTPSVGAARMQVLPDATPSLGPRLNRSESEYQQLFQRGRIPAPPKSTAEFTLPQASPAPGESASPVGTKPSGLTPAARGGASHAPSVTSSPAEGRQPR